MDDDINNFEIINNNLFDNNLIDKVNVKFYWEDLKEKYPVDKNKKYVVYFKGCFAPATNGHMNAIRKIISDFGDDIFIIINQLGFSKRHNVSSEFNKYILEEYIKTIFPNNNISLLFRAKDDEILEHPFLKDIDVLILIKGNEKKINFKIKKNVEKSITKKITNYIDIARKSSAEIHFIVQNRPYDTISATIFVKNLLVYKDKYNSNQPTDEEIDNLLKFIPPEISLKQTIKIVHKLINYNLI